MGLILNMRMLLKGLNLASVQAITPAPSFSSCSAAVAGYLTR